MHRQGQCAIPSRAARGQSSAGARRASEADGAAAAVGVHTQAGARRALSAADGGLVAKD